EDPILQVQPARSALNMLVRCELDDSGIERAKHLEALRAPRLTVTEEDQLVDLGEVPLGDVVQLRSAWIERRTHERVDAPSGAEGSVGLAARLGNESRRDPEVPLQPVHCDLVVGVWRATKLSYGVGVQDHVHLARLAAVPTPVRQPRVLAGLSDHGTVPV